MYQLRFKKQLFAKDLANNSYFAKIESISMNSADNKKVIYIHISNMKIFIFQYEIFCFN